MENKKKTVEDFLQQGEKLMELPGSPKFLETHVNKLKEAWTVSCNVSKSSKKSSSEEDSHCAKHLFFPAGGE